MRGLRSILTVSAGCRLMRHRAIIDAVALQQVVSLPDTVRKTAAIDEDRSGAEQGWSSHPAPVVPSSPSR